MDDVANDLKRENLKKQIIKYWIYFGILLVAILAFWAGDWWSKKLFFTLPIGVIACASIILPVSGGTYMAAKDGFID